MHQQHDSDGSVSSIAELHRMLKAGYQGSEKSTFDAEYYFYRWYRPISLYPTALLLRFGVSANTVTVWGGLCLLSAFVLIAQGRMLAGAQLYLLAYILDFVDGNIARYVGKPNYFGKMIDGLVDSMTFLLFIALGAGNSTAGHALLDPSTEMALGVTTAFVFLLRSYFYLRVSYILVSTRTHGIAVVRAAPVPQARCGILRRGKAIYFGIISAMPLLLLLAVLMEAVSLYLVGYCLVFSLATLFEVAYGLRRVWLKDAPPAG